MGAREAVRDKKKEEEPWRAVGMEQRETEDNVERTERERERRGEGVAMGGEEGIHRTDTSLWLCCMPPGYPASHRLHPSPFLPSSISLTSSFSHRRDPARFSTSLSLSRVLPLSSSLARYAALVRSHSRSPLRCLWSPGSSLLALVRSILHKRERQGRVAKARGRAAAAAAGSLARTNPTDSRNTIPSLVGGLRMVRSHDRNQPG